MPEFAPQHEQYERPAELELALPTSEQAEPLRPGEQDPEQALLEARSRVHETAQSNEANNPLDALKAHEEASEAAPPRVIDNELKHITLNREMRNLQRKENLPERTLSRVIHQPAVRVASEVVGQTVSRPSGLLGGGLVAFLGSTGYLYMAKHIGFSYNYVVFLALFVGGFAVGLLLELIVHLTLKARQK